MDKINKENRDIELKNLEHNLTLAKILILSEHQNFENYYKMKIRDLKNFSKKQDNTMHTNYFRIMKFYNSKLTALKNITLTYKTRWINAINTNKKVLNKDYYALRVFLENNNINLDSIITKITVNKLKYQLNLNIDNNTQQILFDFIKDFDIIKTTKKVKNKIDEKRRATKNK